MEWIEQMPKQARTSAGKGGMIASLASIPLVMVLGNPFHLFGGWLRFFRLWALALA